MQTQQPFKFNRHVATLAALAALALALPMALIVWSLFPKKDVVDPPEPTELRQALENIVDSGLGPSTLEAREISVEVPAVDVAATSASVRELALELGGTCLEPEESEADVRLLVSLPPDKYADFFRRAALLTGKEMPKPPEDQSAPLVSMQIRKATQP